MENIAIGIMLASFAILVLAVVINTFVDNIKISLDLSALAIVLLFIGVSMLVISWTYL